MFDNVILTGAAIKPAVAVPLVEVTYACPAGTSHNEAACWKVDSLQSILNLVNYLVRRSRQPFLLTPPCPLRFYFLYCERAVRLTAETRELTARGRPEASAFQTLLNVPMEAIQDLPNPLAAPRIGERGATVGENHVHRNPITHE